MSVWGGLEKKGKKGDEMAWTIWVAAIMTTAAPDES